MKLFKKELHFISPYFLEIENIFMKQTPVMIVILLLYVEIKKCLLLINI